CEELVKNLARGLLIVAMARRHVADRQLVRGLEPGGGEAGFGPDEQSRVRIATVGRIAKLLVLLTDGAQRVAILRIVANARLDIALKHGNDRGRAACPRRVLPEPPLTVYVCRDQ